MFEIPIYVHILEESTQVFKAHKIKAKTLTAIKQTWKEVTYNLKNPRTHKLVMLNSVLSHHER